MSKFICDEVLAEELNNGISIRILNPRTYEGDPAEKLFAEQIFVRGYWGYPVKVVHEGNAGKGTTLDMCVIRDDDSAEEVVRMRFFPEKEFPIEERELSLFVRYYFPEISSLKWKPFNLVVRIVKHGIRYGLFRQPYERFVHRYQTVFEKKS